MLLSTNIFSQVNARFKIDHGIHIIAITFRLLFFLNYLHIFSLFCQLIDVDLDTQTAVRCGSLRRTGQLLEGLDVLVSEGVGADGTERSRRASAGGEELNIC
jgi:hypothetical protein